MKQSTILANPSFARASRARLAEIRADNARLDAFKRILSTHVHVDNDDLFYVEIVVAAAQTHNHYNFTPAEAARADAIIKKYPV